MINKKLLAIASLVVALSSANVFAKTEGNYFGVDLTRTYAKHKYKGNYVYNSTNKTTDFEGYTFEDAGYGFGLSYKHAFNLGNDIFIAPGVFLERNNTKANAGGYDSGVGADINGNVKIKGRQGIKLDVGYDIDPKLAIYATTGVSNVSYRIDGSANVGTLNASGVKSSSKNGVFYGVGLIHNCNKNLATTLEFTTQTIDLNTPYSNKIKTDLRVFKLGASYRF